MRIAQQLYEGIEIGDDTGLITYMRTDSVSLSDEAVTELRDFIAKKYGKDQVPDAARTQDQVKKCRSPRSYKTNFGRA